MAFACSLLLCPQPHRHSLRSTFPWGETTGLPRSASRSAWGGLCLSAGSATSAVGDNETPTPGHVPFGSSLWAVSIIGLSLITTFSSTSLALTRPRTPSPRTAGCWRSQFQLTLSLASHREYGLKRGHSTPYKTRIHCRTGLAPSVSRTHSVLGDSSQKRRLRLSLPFEM